jgi:hypothetical protein
MKQTKQSEDYLMEAGSLIEKASREELIDFAKKITVTAFKNKQKSEKNFEAAERWKKCAEDWKALYFKAKHIYRSALGLE